MNLRRQPGSRPAGGGDDAQEPILEAHGGGIGRVVPAAVPGPLLVALVQGPLLVALVQGPSWAALGRSSAGAMLLGRSWSL